VALYSVVTPYESAALNVHCGTAFFVAFTVAMAAGLPSLDQTKKISAGVVLACIGFAFFCLTRYTGWWGTGPANALEWGHWVTCWVYLMAAAVQTGKGSTLQVLLIDASPQGSEFESEEPQMSLRRGEAHPYRAGYVKMEV